MTGPADRTPFYERLERMAAEAGFSMNRLGQAIGKSGPAMIKWRTGKAKPTLETRRDIARVLNRPLADLLFDDDPEELKRAAASADRYESLQSFVDRHPDTRITDDELAWLESQRFPGGDAGDDEWWIGQLMRYRGLMLRAKPGGSGPVARAQKAETSRKPERPRKGA